MVADDSAASRLLLVSDHRRAADALTAYLRRRGFEVTLAESVAEVREVLAAEGTRPASSADGLRAASRSLGVPDIALIDAETAGGWQAILEEVRMAVPPGRIAVLASYWSASHRQEAHAQGVGAILLKSTSGPTLALRLEALQGRAR